MTGSENGAADAPTTDGLRLEASLPMTPTPADASQSGQTGQSGRGDERKSQKIDLEEICKHCLLFHSPEGEPYASVRIRGHRETFSIEGRDFKRWLEHEYFKSHRSAPAKDALDSAIGTCALRARYEGPEHLVFVRCGKYGEKLYLDLADPMRQAVEISHEGWRVVEHPPVYFLRPKLLLALPVPKRGGSLDELRALLNVTNQHDFQLIVAWLVAALNPDLRCPLLAIQGEAGSAKSTASRIIRQLIDPSTALIRPMPRDIKALYIAATSARVLALDNLSKLTPFMSDTLCCIVTGASHTDRKYYTDRDEIAFNVRNPIVLNGIGGFISRSDLRDRSIQIFLKRIAQRQRRGDREIEAAFERTHASILGVVLGGVSTGLRELPNTHALELPRMADFVLWGTACEPAFGWAPGTIAAAFEANQHDAVERAVDADPLLSAICSLMQAQSRWKGMASELLGALIIQTNAADAKSLPSSPSALGQELERVATSLRKIGIEIDRTREGKGRDRIITITRRADEVREGDLE